MAEYLSPNDKGLVISDHRDIFSIRNRMVPISENFLNTQTENFCSCGQISSMRHIYICTNMNIENEKIFDDNVRSQKQVYDRFKQTFETLLYSNGNK